MEELLADAIDCIEALLINSPTWTTTEVEQTLRRLREALEKERGEQ